MKNLKKSHLLLIVISVLILSGCIGLTAYLLFSNFQNVRLFKQAQNNFLRGEPDSLALAEIQLKQLIRSDNDNEAAYITLSAIAEKRKIYPEQVYYSYMAHRLNPLSQENKDLYIKALCFARYFDRLENFLSQQHDLSDEYRQLLLYSAGRNGNLPKYKAQFSPQDNCSEAGELTRLLFQNRQLSPGNKIAALDNMSGNDFLKQEILAAKAELYLESGDIDNAEKSLQDAFALNPYAFAPALGRFYANFRTLKQALTVFETHLSVYHDPVIALHTAEIYCLLRRRSEITRLRNQYQADSGNQGMLLCYYFDALNAFAGNDFAALNDLLIPLRKRISTPLALFIFLCADIQEKNLPAIRESYNALLLSSNYADLHSRADELLSGFLQSNFAALRDREEELLLLANSLYSRKKEPFTAKYILLAQKRRNNVNAALLKDALERFKNDPGISKIAIEHFLAHDPAAGEKLIAGFKQSFPENAKDMLRYEIFLALRKKDFDLASRLFRGDFSPALRADYWKFASSTMREEDLIFLSRDTLYAPFCQALLLIKKGEKHGACDLLEKADAKGNLPLLFFAAGTLAENGRNRAALAKYALFPADSSYQLDVLLNTAEIFAESGNVARALELSAKAYRLAPELPETQFCYADKLYKNGSYTEIPDVVKLRFTTSPFYRRMKEMWITGMQKRITSCDMDLQQNKLREMVNQLLRIDPENQTGRQYLQKLQDQQRK